MKIIEVLYITKYPYDMILNDLKKHENLKFKKELLNLNAVVFENELIRNIYYIQPVADVLKFSKHRLFDKILNIKLLDKPQQKTIKLSLR